MFFPTSTYSPVASTLPLAERDTLEWFVKSTLHYREVILHGTVHLTTLVCCFRDSPMTRFKTQRPPYLHFPLASLQTQRSGTTVLLVRQ